MQAAMKMMQNMKPGEMEQLMKGVTPEQMRQAQAMASKMSPDDWKRAQEQMAGMTPDQLRQQAQQGAAQLGAQQKYILTVRPDLGCAFN